VSEWLLVIKLTRFGKRRLWPTSKYYPIVHLDALGKAKNTSVKIIEIQRKGLPN
jgi:hypothetical protein